MGTALSTLLLVIFGIYIGTCALLLDAKKIQGIDFLTLKFPEKLEQEPPPPPWLPPPSPLSPDSPLLSPPSIPEPSSAQSPPPPESPLLKSTPPHESPLLQTPPPPETPTVSSPPPPETPTIPSPPPPESLPTPSSPLLESPPYSENSPQEPINGDGAKSPTQSSKGNHHGQMSIQPPPLSSAEVEMNSAQRVKMNSGKKVGLVFLFFAGVLQIAVAGFLGLKRGQLLTEAGNP